MEIMVAPTWALIIGRRSAALFLDLATVLLGFDATFL